MIVYSRVLCRCATANVAVCCWLVVDRAVLCECLIKSDTFVQRRCSSLLFFFSYFSSRLPSVTLRRYFSFLFSSRSRAVLAVASPFLSQYAGNEWQNTIFFMWSNWRETCCSSVFWCGALCICFDIYMIINEYRYINIVDADVISEPRRCQRLILFFSLCLRSVAPTHSHAHRICLYFGKSVRCTTYDEYVELFISEI